jgi:hypothetical protein
VGPPVEFEFDVWRWTVTGHRTIVRGGEGDGDDFRAHLVAVDADGRVVFDLEQEHAIQGAAAADNDQLVTQDCYGFFCTLQRRDPATGAPVGEPVGHGDAGFGRIVGGGGVLVAVADDGQVLVLDPDTLLPAGGPLPGISVSADVLTLSADGRRLLLVGDRSIRFYDIASRTQLGDAIPIGRESGGALRPDGLEAAVGTDHGIVVWDLDPEHWVDGACAIAGRNLTRAEWDQYIGNLASYRTTCPEYEPAE